MSHSRIIWELNEGERKKELSISSIKYHVDKIDKKGKDLLEIIINSYVLRMIELLQTKK